MQAFSAQPLFGGSVYFIRNISYQVSGTSLKFTIRPAGIFLFHNTFCSETSIPEFSNGHFRNNLFLGPNDSRPAINGTTLTDYSTLDYNGYRIKPKAEFSYGWRLPLADNPNHADASELPWTESKTLAAFSQKSGYESHGIELDYDIFQHVPKPDPEKRFHVYAREGVDFRLKAGSKAVDAGCILHNINDGFHGKAPDLGASELGSDAVHYGQRIR